MLSKVKDSVISKKVAFKAGGGQSKVVHTAVNCLVGSAIGSVIAFAIWELITVISAIKGGEEFIHTRAAFLGIKD